jgi:hypothetical protein
MTILHATLPLVKITAANPRDSWPAWTDRISFTVTPEPTINLSDPAFLAEPALRSPRCLTRAEHDAWRAENPGHSRPPEAWLPVNRASSVRVNLTPWTGIHPLHVEPEDTYRPTAGPDFAPTVEDQNEYLAMLAELDAREDIMAEWAAEARAEAMERSFAGGFDLVSDAEIVEAMGCHPAMGHELP